MHPPFVPCVALEPSVGCSTSPVQVRAHAQTQPQPPVFTDEPVIMVEPVPPTTPRPRIDEQDLSGLEISPAQHFRTTAQNAAMAGMAHSLRPPLATVGETFKVTKKWF